MIVSLSKLSSSSVAQLVRTPQRFSGLLLVSTLLVAGCSGSDSSSDVADLNVIQPETANNTTGAGGDTVSNEDPTVTVAPITSAPVTSDTGESESGVETPPISVIQEETELSEPATDSSDANAADEENNSLVSFPDFVVSDTFAPTVTRIDFDITVPAYQSNALQVKLVWGEKELTAAWIIDESWAISDEFPTDTEEQLIVTFNDNNGAITLGSFETAFNTGDSAAATFQITADQFNTSQWDNDEDGISNFDELSSGTDPLVTELEPEGLLESFDLPAYFTRRPGPSEGLIPAQRPYLEQTEENPARDPRFAYTILTRIIELDESGTGTYFEDSESYEPPNSTFEERAASRTNTGDSIVWSGTYSYFFQGSGWRENAEFTTETKVIDAQTRSQTGEIEFLCRGGCTGLTGRMSYSLIGRIIPDSVNCEAIAGTVTVENLRVDQTITDNFTKELGDRYWMNSNGEFARALENSFRCDHADI